MQCLILAGGLGTRMAALTEGSPKNLHSVLGRPFVDHQLEWLAGEGIDRVVFAIGHGGELIRDHVGDGSAWGVRVTYSDDGETLLGTGGAVRHAVERGLMDDGFFVLYGDSYLRVDFADVWKASRHGSLPVMTVFRNEGRWDTSNAVFDGAKVTLFEKGRSDFASIGMDFIDYGLSVLPGSIATDEIPEEGPSDLADLFHGLSVSGRLIGHEVFDRFYEVGSPEGHAELERFSSDDRS